MKKGTFVGNVRCVRKKVLTPSAISDASPEEVLSPDSGTVAGRT